MKENEEVKEMTYGRNLMSYLDDAWGKDDENIDEEVEEEVADPKSAEKLMPLGKFIGSKNAVYVPRTANHPKQGTRNLLPFSLAI